LIHEKKKYFDDITGFTLSSLLYIFCKIRKNDKRIYFQLIYYGFIKLHICVT